MMVEHVLEIVNQKGLHARASAKFVEVVEQFDARATVSRDGIDASGDSIMALLMLGAAKGSHISLSCEGAQAAELAHALQALVADRFGEDS